MTKAEKRISNDESIATAAQTNLTVAVENSRLMRGLMSTSESVN